MPDQSLVKALSDSIEKTTQIVFVLLVAVVIAWIFQRLLFYILIEKGWKRKIKNKIDSSTFCKKMTWFFNPDIELLKEPEILTESLSNKNDLKISYDPANRQSTVEYLEEELIFSRRRALLLLFFYENREGKKTYNDFNAWLYNRNNKTKKIGYRVFRQEIKKVNGNIDNKSKYISEIINCVESDINNSTKANFYKYKPSLKKL